MFQIFGKKTFFRKKKFSLSKFLLLCCAVFLFMHSCTYVLQRLAPFVQAQPSAFGIFLHRTALRKGGGAASLFLHHQRRRGCFAFFAKQKNAFGGGQSPPRCGLGFAPAKQPRQKKALLRRGYWQNLGANNSRG